MHAVFGGTSQAAVALKRFHLVLAHEELKALGVLSDNLVLALLDGCPVQLGTIDALNAKFLCGFQVVVDFGVEQQRLGGNAADVQAGSTQLVVFFDQTGFQSPLPGANSGGVPCRAATDDCDVVDLVRQSSAP